MTTWTNVQILCVQVKHHHAHSIDTNISKSFFFLETRLCVVFVCYSTLSTNSRHIAWKNKSAANNIFPFRSIQSCCVATTSEIFWTIITFLLVMVADFLLLLLLNDLCHMNESNKRAQKKNCAFCGTRLFIAIVEKCFFFFDFFFDEQHGECEERLNDGCAKLFLFIEKS